MAGLDAPVTVQGDTSAVELPALAAARVLRQLTDLVADYAAAVAARDTRTERDRLARLLGYVAAMHGERAPDGRWVLAIPLPVMSGPVPEVTARRDNARGLLVFRVRHG